MCRGRRLRWIALAALVAFASLGIHSCSRFGLGSIFLFFRAPLFGQLSLPEGIELELSVSGLVDPATLSVKLDGEPLDPGTFSPISHGLATTLDVEPGRHILRAEAELVLGWLAVPLEAATFFDAVELDRPDECEVLNDASCILPFPSSRFQVPAATRTGSRLAYPDLTLPGLDPPTLSAEPFDHFDGYTPTVQALMHFRGEVDLQASGASILLGARCCGQAQTTPYVDVRTHDGRSLEPDSPTVLLEVETGRRILHWVEMDAQAEGSPERQVMFLRPAKALVPGHHYIIAVRGLVDTEGRAIRPEPAFRALRDQRPTTIPAIEARRDHFESLFDTLEEAGVARRELQLAYDFGVRSDEQLTEQLLFMRDDALAWLEGLAPDDISGFSGIEVTDFGDCSDPDQAYWRRVQGDFAGPYYLTGDMDDPASLTLLNVPEGAGDRIPERNGTFPMAWDVAIPCEVYLGEEPGHPLLLGHGFLGEGSQMVDGAIGGAFVGETDVAYIPGATDWRGLSRGVTGPDALFLLLNVLGTPQTGQKFDNFPALPARLQQGMVNTLVLSRMMKSGFLNRLPELQRVPGDPSTGVFPGPSQEMFYFGVSLGGIQGTLYAALNQDVIRHNVDVPAMNFSILEQRSTQFPLFLALIELLGLTDPMDLAIVLQLQHEIWASAEPAGYIRHVTGLVDPPLRDTPPKHLLVTVAFLDKQVSNQATEIYTRSLGIPNLEGSVQARLQEIPDVDPDARGGVDSGMVIYDTGYFDIFDPAHDPFLPPLANEIPSSKCDPHGLPRLSIPASVEQLGAFLRPGGRIFNFCDGACDARSAHELPAVDCDPLAP